jgi:hypothetical protein
MHLQLSVYVKDSRSPDANLPALRAVGDDIVGNLSGHHVIIHDSDELLL